MEKMEVAERQRDLGAGPSVSASAKNDPPGQGQHSSSSCGPCAVCSKPCETQCARCKDTNYCSKEHQLAHWKVHKLDCAPVKLVPSTEYETYGHRVLLATRDIAQGEIIFKEKPILSGPLAETKLAGGTYPLCLNCNKLLPGAGSIGLGANSCSKCSWAVCGRACEKGKLHSENECEILAKSRTKPTNMIEEYLVVQIIRAFLLKSKDPEAYNKLLSLNQAVDKSGNIFDKQLITMLHHRLVLEYGLGSGNKSEDLKTIRSILRILIFNRFTDAVSCDRGPTNIPLTSFVYFKTSFLAHSCVPNTEWFIQNNGTVIVRASIPIPKGSLVTLSKTKTEMTSQTTPRHNALRSIFGMNCKCDRCKDPTELGSMIGAIKCKAHGCSDYYLPKNKHDDKFWYCLSPTCTSRISRDAAYKIDEKSHKELDRFISTRRLYPTEQKAQIEWFQEAEKYIAKYNGKILHPNHSLLYTHKRMLAAISLPQFKDQPEGIEVVMKQIGWARECLSVADKIFPGFTTERAHVMDILQEALRTLVNYKGEKNLPNYKEITGEIRKHREEIKKILEIERDGTMLKRIHQTVVEQDYLEANLLRNIMSACMGLSFGDDDDSDEEDEEDEEGTGDREINLAESCRTS